MASTDMTSTDMTSTDMTSTDMTSTDMDVGLARALSETVPEGLFRRTSSST